MLDAKSEIFNYVLEKAESEPLKKRIALYRALGELAGNEETTNRFVRMATDLELADQKCREFAFHFSNPTPAVLPPVVPHPAPSQKSKPSGHGNGHKEGK